MSEFNDLPQEIADELMFLQSMFGGEESGLVVKQPSDGGAEPDDSLFIKSNSRRSSSQPKNSQDSPLPLLTILLPVHADNKVLTERLGVLVRVDLPQGYPNVAAAVSAKPTAIISKEITTQLVEELDRVAESFVGRVSAFDIFLTASDWLTCESTRNRGNLHETSKAAMRASRGSSNTGRGADETDESDESQTGLYQDESFDMSGPLDGQDEESLRKAFLAMVKTNMPASSSGGPRGAAGGQASMGLLESSVGVGRVARLLRSVKSKGPEGEQASEVGSLGLGGTSLAIGTQQSAPGAIRRNSDHVAAEKKSSALESKKASALESKNAKKTPSRYEQDFEELCLLGKGSFGEVTKVRNKIDGQIYAVKRVRFHETECVSSPLLISLNDPKGKDSKGKSRGPNEPSGQSLGSPIGSGSSVSDAMKLVLTEVSTLCQIQSKNVLGYYQAWIEEKRIPADQTSSGRKMSGCAPDRHSPRNQTDDGGDGRDLHASSTEFLRSVAAPHFSDDLMGSDQMSRNDFFNRGSMVASGPLAGSGPLIGSGDQLAGSGTRALSGHTTSPLGNTLVSSSSGNPHGVLSPTHGILSPTLSPEPVRLVQVYDLYIQTAYCPLTLSEWIVSKAGEATSDEIWKICRGIVEGLSSIHACGIIHRDLKPGNIFIDASGEPKIGDFGLATSSTEKSNSASPDSNNGSSSGSNAVNVVGGTRLYASPEQLDQMGFAPDFSAKPSKPPADARDGLSTAPSSLSDRSDIFSLGLVLLELWCPFPNLTLRVQTLLSARSGRLPAPFAESHPRQWRIISACLRPSAQTRPSALEILRNEKFFPARMLDEDITEAVRIVSNYGTHAFLRVLSALMTSACSHQAQAVAKSIPKAAGSIGRKSAGSSTSSDPFYDSAAVIRGLLSTSASSSGAGRSSRWSSDSQSSNSDAISSTASFLSTCKVVASIQEVFRVRPGVSLQSSVGGFLCSMEELVDKEPELAVNLRNLDPGRTLVDGLGNVRVLTKHSMLSGLLAKYGLSILGQHISELDELKSHSGVVCVYDLHSFHMNDSHEGLDSTRTAVDFLMLQSDPESIVSHIASAATWREPESSAGQEQVRLLSEFAYLVSECFSKILDSSVGGSVSQTATSVSTSQGTLNSSGSTSSLGAGQTYGGYVQGVASGQGIQTSLGFSPVTSIGPFSLKFFLRHSLVTSFTSACIKRGDLPIESVAESLREASKLILMTDARHRLVTFRKFMTTRGFQVQGPKLVGPFAQCASFVPTSSSSSANVLSQGDGLLAALLGLHGSPVECIAGKLGELFTDVSRLSTALGVPGNCILLDVLSPDLEQNESSVSANTTLTGPQANLNSCQTPIRTKALVELGAKATRSGNPELFEVASAVIHKGHSGARSGHNGARDDKTSSSHLGLFGRLDIDEICRAKNQQATVSGSVAPSSSIDVLIAFCGRSQFFGYSGEKESVRARNGASALFVDLEVELQRICSVFRKSGRSVRVVRLPPGGQWTAEIQEQASELDARHILILREKDLFASVSAAIKAARTLEGDSDAAYARTPISAANSGNSSDDESLSEEAVYTTAGFLRVGASSYALSDSLDYPVSSRSIVKAGQYSREQMLKKSDAIKLILTSWRK